MELLTPEEQSEAIVKVAFDNLLANRDVLGLELDCEDAGDDLVLYVRLSRVGGRSYLLQVTCDDYPRQAPLLRFVDPRAWTDLPRRHDVAPEFYPNGDYVARDRGLLPVLCLKGQRDYYRDGWHDGWTNPPTGDHELVQMITNVSIAIHSRWT